jgi:hypothetical protein
MYFHLPNVLATGQLADLYSEILPVINCIPKQLNLTEVQTGVEYDLTRANAIPVYKQLVEKICSSKYNKQLQCLNYWVSISRTGTSVIRHNHFDENMCDVSAVLYIQTHNNCGHLQLEDYSASLPVNAGDLVTFPTKCYHSVGVNLSEYDRICIGLDLKHTDSYGINIKRR